MNVDQGKQRSSQSLYLRFIDANYKENKVSYPNQHRYHSSPFAFASEIGHDLSDKSYNRQITLYFYSSIKFNSSILYSKDVIDQQTIQTGVILSKIKTRDLNKAPTPAGATTHRGSFITCIHTRFGPFCENLSNSPTIGVSFFLGYRFVFKYVQLMIELLIYLESFESMLLKIEMNG